MALLSYKGYDIDVNNDGLFTASAANGAQLIKATFNGLKEELDKEIKLKAKDIRISLPITGVTYSRASSPARYRERHCTIVGISRVNSSLVLDQPTGDEWYCIMPDSDQTRQLAQDLAKALNHNDELRDRAAALTVKLPYSGRITADEYEGKVQQLAGSYNAAAEKAALAEGVAR